MSQRPTVLFLTHRTPYPPDKGDRIRTYNVLRFLSTRAEVHLACLADEWVSPEQNEGMHRFASRVGVVPIGPSRWVSALTSLATGGTVSQGAFRSGRLTDLLRSWAREVRYDACLVSASSLVPYMELPELRSTPAVVDLIDLDSQKWLDYAAAGGLKALLYRLEGRRLREVEKQLSSRFRAAVVVSEVEAELYRHFGPNGMVHVIPNGVDLDYFAPQAAKAVLGCVFVGAFDYKPNVLGAAWFCREIWPELRRRHPEARCRLVGRKPTAAVTALAAIPGVEVVGQVPDVRPYVASASVVIAPLQIARGIQNKVLEALSMAKAVVASPQAFAGIAAKAGEHLIEAQDAGAWVQAIETLWKNPDERVRLGKAGRAFVEANHCWQACLEPLAGLLGLSDTPAVAAQRHELLVGETHP
ncbi:MAG TPA: TIGR03087 family PEP-CTERM/XrtA system glycosyltransferase [Gemmataceae bacterium]|nr:TIGR03087 family PEP-CTERM/XrtA system glycosyltransferase [Gemmataceae bacterium]